MGGNAHVKLAALAKIQHEVRLRKSPANGRAPSKSLPLQKLSRFCFG